MGYCVEFFPCWSNGTSIRSPRKKLGPSCPPFNVTQGHWNGQDRAGTSDFLLTFHRKYGSVFYHFQDRTRNYVVKIKLEGHLLERNQRIKLRHGIVYGDQIAVHC